MSANFGNMLQAVTIGAEEYFTIALDTQVFLKQVRAKTQRGMRLLVENTVVLSILSKTVSPLHFQESRF